jgi:hypothetical protein
MGLFHRHRRSAVTAAFIGLTIGAGCSSKTPTTPTRTVSSVAVTGGGATAAVGQSATLVATATFSDNTTSVVTTQAAWVSSNTTVATVTAAGVVSFLEAGGVDIRATYSGATGSTHVEVSPPPPTLTAITVSGVGSSATVGSTGNLIATATYSNNSTAIVTSQVTWSTSNTAVATVTAAGVVTFIGAGDVDLRATLSGVTGSTRVTVSAQAAFKNLDGVVRDAVSDQPIEGVVVRIRGGADDGRSTQTNNAGFYSFSGLQTGSFTIEFSTDKAYASTSRDVTLSNDARVDVSLTPDVARYYGTFNISLTMTQSTCQPPPNLSGFGSGTLLLAGQANGTGFTAKITERDVSRTYTGGRMNVDGSFNGAVPPGTLFPGWIRLLHEISGTIQGKVTGTSVNGTESITYTVGCQPGATATILLNGNK